MNLPNRETINKFSPFLNFFLLSLVILLLVNLDFSQNIDFQANASEPVAIQSVGQGDAVEQNKSGIVESQEVIAEVDSEIHAESVLSVEFDSSGSLEEKILFEKDAQQKLPMASLAKMMTALIVMENFDLNQQVTINKEAMEQIGEQGLLKEGEVHSVKNLLYTALIKSSNRAAFTLAQVMGNDAFVVLMNERAKELRLTNTYFADSTGISENSYSTAHDLVTLSEHLFVKYPLFGEIVGLKEFDLFLSDGSLHHKLENTNELLGQYDIIGGKTGYTNAAKGCFMAIQKKGLDKHVMHIVLGSDDRFLDMEKLIAKTNNP